MTWIVLYPRTPLLFRTGRQWGVETAGLGMDWPMPHQVLGAARSAAGEATGFDWDFAGDVPPVVGPPDRPGIRVIGAWLCAVQRDGSVDAFWPRPADLVAFPKGASRPDDNSPDRYDHPLRPGSAAVSRPHGLETPLQPLFHRDPERPGKPLGDDRVPPLVASHEILNLLTRPGSAPAFAPGNPAAPSPLRAPRTRVSIDPDRDTAEDGALFTTGGIDLPVPRTRKGNWGESRYGVLVRIEGGAGVELDKAPLAPGIWRLGGKGGLADAEVARAPESLDTLRDAVVEDFGASSRFRWVLAGPARFAGGWRPGWIGSDGSGTFPLPEGGGVPVRLVAAAVGRPVTYSGWDLQARGARRGGASGAARPSRRFVPAGSVYFFERTDGGPAADVARPCWLQPIEDPHLPPADETRFLDAACASAAGFFGLWDPFEREDRD